MSKSLSRKAPSRLWPIVCPESPVWDSNIYVSKMITYFTVRIRSYALATDVGSAYGDLYNPSKPFNFAEAQLV